MAWKGTHLSFYKIFVDNDLVKGIKKGKNPATPTKVYKNAPLLLEEPSTDKLWLKAISESDACLEAFKMFLGVKKFGD
jgi:hypothetical protein